MHKTLFLTIAVLVLALLFVGLGWLLGRRGGASDAATRQDLGQASTAILQRLDERADGLSRQVDARADALERKLDILLNIATNVPPDLRK